MVGQISQLDIAPGGGPPEYFIQIRFPTGELRSGLIEFFESRTANATAFEATIDVGTATPENTLLNVGGFDYYTFEIPAAVAEALRSGNPRNHAVVFHQIVAPSTVLQPQHILAFGSGDNSFIFENSTVSSLNDSNFNTYLGIAAGGGIQPLGTTFVILPDGTVSTGSTDPGAPPPCFCAGTLIATARGEVAVEDLRPGDLVLTVGGEALPLRWLGRVAVAARFVEGSHGLPIRITAGALGEGLPKRDLLVSPGHAMFLDGVLVNAGALVNGTTIRREAEVPEVFHYYHVELDRHALILAEGAPTESFLDTVEPGRFDNGAERPEWPAGAAMEELPYPRASSARQVPARVRARIAAAAAELGTAADAAA